jgi:transcription-repair coupling factor (superfamily II helicase)
MVGRRGEFAVRGGILDVFPPDAAHPIRVDFFGNDIESMTPFSVADQRSLDEHLTSLELGPSRELLLTDSVRQRAREMVLEFPNISTMLEKIAQGIPVEGMESLTPALVDQLVPLTHFAPAGTAVAVLSPERVRTRAAHVAQTNNEFLDAAWHAASVGASAPIDLSSGDFLELDDLRAGFLGPWWTLSSFISGDDDEVRIPADPVPLTAGDIDAMVQHIGARQKDGWSVVVAVEGAGLVERAGQQDFTEPAEILRKRIEDSRQAAENHSAVAAFLQANRLRNFRQRDRSTFNLHLVPPCLPVRSPPRLQPRPPRLPRRLPPRASPPLPPPQAPRP